MMQQSGPGKEVSNLVTLFHQDVIGPSFMWLGIADALTPANASAVLDSLSSEIKAKLRDAWLGQPPHAFIEVAGSPGDEAFREVCVQIVRWCEKSGPPEELPTEPDGLTRVRVVDGAVREWRPWDNDGGSGTG